MKPMTVFMGLIGMHFLAGCADLTIEMMPHLAVQSSQTIIAHADKRRGDAVQIRGTITRTEGVWVLDNQIELRPSYVESLKQRKIGDEIVVRGYLKKGRTKSGVPFRLDSAYYTPYNALSPSRNVPWRKQ